MLQKLTYKLFFNKMHGVDAEFQNLADELVARDATQAHIERFIEHSWRAGDRWSRKFPYCNYHTEA